MTAVDGSRMWTRDSLAEFLELELVPRARESQSPMPSERALSESLGVSRSLVREALRGLEQRGLIEIVPGKGAYSRDPSSAELARAMRGVLAVENSTAGELVEARRTLETQTATLAAQRATSSEIAAISKALDDFDGADSLVARATAAGFETWITADHGNLECLPSGAVSEGVGIEAAGKRLRRYPNAVLRGASKADGITWDDVPGLPTMHEALMYARGQTAFTNQQLTVSHGGLSLDEVIVPLAQVTA